MAPSEQTLAGADSASPTTTLLPWKTPGDPVSVRLDFSALTHVGKVRANNEDQHLIVRLRKSLDVVATSLRPEQYAQPLQREGYLLLVADGLGGHAGGERASALVVSEIIKHVMETAKWFFRLDDPDEGVRLRLLREGLERLDRKLIEAGESDRALAGMGTTLTTASIIDAEAFLVHVGDSRAYLMRNGRLEQLTTDHTLVQQMVDGGLMRPEEARTHRLRHHLTNVIGGSPGVEGEIVKLTLADGDRLLLCTDGLTEPVRDSQIAEILSGQATPDSACQALVEAALGNGGPDNITVVVATCSIQAG
jgi:serine/threonine protein phosphatase PrpC